MTISVIAAHLLIVYGALSLLLVIFEIPNT